MCYPEVMKAIGASEESFKYLDRTPNVPPDGYLEPENLEGHIEFKNVSFSYLSKTAENNVVLKVCMVICVFVVFKGVIYGGLGGHNPQNQIQPM